MSDINSSFLIWIKWAYKVIPPAVREEFRWKEEKDLFSLDVTNGYVWKYAVGTSRATISSFNSGQEILDEGKGLGLTPQEVSNVCVYGVWLYVNHKYVNFEDCVNYILSLRPPPEKDDRTNLEKSLDAFESYIASCTP